MEKEMQNDFNEIVAVKTKLIQNLLEADLIKLPALYKAIVYEILVENKTYAQVAMSHQISQNNVRSLFMKTCKRLTGGIYDVKNLLQQFEGILQKNDLNEKEAGHYTNGLLNVKDYIESFGIEYTPDLAITLALRIDDFELDVRTKNICRWHDVETLMDLVMLGRETISNTRNCGKKTLNILERFIESKGLYWFV